MDSHTTGSPSPEEEWRPVAGWPGYEISSLGRLGSWKKSPNERQPPTSRRILVGGHDKDGYRRAVLVNGPARRSLKIHQLVMQAFIGPAPFPAAVTRHLNGDNADNRPVNLAWGSQQQNIDDRERLGRTRRGQEHHNAVLTDEQVSELRSLRSSMTCSEAAKRFAISTACVYAIWSGRSRASSS